MSHCSRIEVEIHSLEALKKACKKLGFQFMEGQKTYQWFGRYMGDWPLPDGYTREELGACEHAIKVPGAAYEVGVIKSRQKPGSYELIWDFWSGGGLVPILGTEGENLIESYTIEQTKLTAKNQGYFCEEKKLKNGATKLYITVQ
jgi:hypothetical protein